MRKSSYLKALRNGASPGGKHFGFQHPEPHGVWAITEKGGHGKGLAATRLYVYPDPDTETLYQITIGDKQTQPADIKFSREFVADLRKKAEQEHHEPGKNDPPEGTQEGEKGEEVP